MHKDMRETWKIMKKIIRKNTKYETCHTQKIIINKEEITNPK